MMSEIPKVVHYCWFGKGNMPALSQRCLESWREKLPGFEIKCWDESNAPADIPFVQDMLTQKKWAFASDYVRLYALYTEGGVYLDTDMEVVQDFTPLLGNECFVGYESAGRVTTGAMGAASGSKYVRECMELMSERHSNKQEYWIAPEVGSFIFDKHDSAVVAYPVHYFYPFNPYDTSVATDILMFADIKPDTYAIHHWNHAWKMGFLERVVRAVKKILGR
jgi:mannosyltransferase OCH1-like enzyme